MQMHSIWLPSPVRPVFISAIIDVLMFCIAQFDVTVFNKATEEITALTVHHGDRIAVLYKLTRSPKEAFFYKV
jgi:hypothetical protein